MKYITISLVALSITLLCGVAHAHQDRLLKFEEGKLTGLPEAYLPASFDVNELSVTIAGKKLVLPEVFHRLLKKNENIDPFDGPRKMEYIPCAYTFSASWYHSQQGSDLPPYILVTITPADRDCHIEILVAMDSLKILRADVKIKSLGSVPIDLNGGPTTPKK